MNTNEFKEKIISEFSQLLKNSNASNEPKMKWKIINYKKVITMLKRSKKDLSSTDEALAILREEGMKFTSEKKQPYKSKILLNIEEIIKQGYLSENKENQNNPKVITINELIRLPEIGPVKAEKLYEEGIKNITDLNQRKDLLNRKQLIGLRHYEDLEIRIPREEMDQWNDKLLIITEKVINTIDINRKNKINLINMELVGSYRRGLDTSGDIDFYIAVSKPTGLLMKSIVNCLTNLNIISDEDIISQGTKKTMTIGRLTPESIFRHIDIFIFSKEEYPFALMFATGSAEFNIRLRNYSLSIGWSLSDKGFKKNNSKGNPPTREDIVSRINKLYIETELDIFEFLGLQYILPQKRFPNVTLENK